MNAHASWRQRPFNVIAHRGASGYEPENTLAAFQKAIDLGADMVELDAHLSRDGELVVIHDERLERLTSGFGFVSDYTVSELKQFKILKQCENGDSERIPTLREVFELIGKRVGVVVELKTGYFLYDGIEAKTARLLEEFDLLDDAIVIAFHHPTLQAIKRVNPQIATGILYSAGLLEPWAVAERSARTCCTRIIIISGRKSSPNRNGAATAFIPGQLTPPTTCAAGKPS